MMDGILLFLISEAASNVVGSLLDLPKNKIENAINDIKKDAKLQKAFVEAGERLGSFAAENDALCREIRNVFSQDNLKRIFRDTRSVSGYEWESIIRSSLHKSFETCEMDPKREEFYVSGFLYAVKKVICKLDSEYYDRVFLSEFREEVREQGTRTMEMDRQILSGLQELRDGQRRIEQRISAQHMPLKHLEDKSLNQSGSIPVEGGFVENILESSSGDEYSGGELKLHLHKEDHATPEWKIQLLDIKGVHGTEEERKEEIPRVAAVWRKERLDYPNWYIPPYAIRDMLRWSSNDMGLSQYGHLVTAEEMLDYAFELAWRYETALLSYSGVMQQNIKTIWEQYEENGQWTDSDRNQAWFYLGQCLLREYREDGRSEEWEAVRNKLVQHLDFAVNGEQELRLEEIKMDFMMFRLNRVKQELTDFQVKKEEYPIRLQLTGMMAECGMWEMAKTGLEQLTRELREKLERVSEQKDRTNLTSLLAAALYRYALLLQGMCFMTSDADDSEAAALYREAAELDAYFDFDREEHIWGEKMSLWYIKAREEKIPFELNKEYKTILGGGNGCEEAYGFFRLMDRAVMPLLENHIRALSNLEEVWLCYLLAVYPHIGRYMLLRCSQTKYVENCMTRAFLASVEQEWAEQIFTYAKQALVENLDRIGEISAWHDGSIYYLLAENGLIILQRTLTRCSEALQVEAVVFLKELMEKDCIHSYRKLDNFIDFMMHTVSDRVKANMLRVLLSCSLAERKMWHSGDKPLDPFDVFTYKELALPMYRQAQIEERQLNTLFSRAAGEGRSRAIAIARLATLFDLGLLRGAQAERLGELLWRDAMGEGQLPQINEYYLVSYLRWPHPESVDVDARVKTHLLREDWIKELNHENGSRSYTFGRIVHFMDIIRINEERTPDYWTPGETEGLVRQLINFWEADKEILRKASERLFSLEEELRCRYDGVLRVLASFGSCLRTSLLEKSRERLQGMLREMETLGFAVWNVRIYLPEADTETEMEELLIDGLYHEDRTHVVSAAIAVESVLQDQKSPLNRERIFEELIRLARAGKEPGWAVYLNVIHNVFYRRSMQISEYQLEMLGKVLDAVERKTQYLRHAESEERTKTCIEVRRSCASLAYQIYLYERDLGLQEITGPVLHWKHICTGEVIAEEFAEVRAQWL